MEWISGVCRPLIPREYRKEMTCVSLSLAQISCDLDVWFIPSQMLTWMFVYPKSVIDLDVVLIRKFSPWKEEKLLLTQN